MTPNSTITVTLWTHPPAWKKLPKSGDNDNSFDGIINNTPTVDELEAKVKAGETISLDTDFLYLCGHCLYIGMVYLNDIPVNGNLPQICRHVPGGYELHFFQY